MTASSMVPVPDAVRKTQRLSSGTLRSPSVRCSFSSMTCENPALFRCGRRIPIAPLGALSTLVPRSRASRAKAFIGHAIMLLLG